MRMWKVGAVCGLALLCALFPLLVLFAPPEAGAVSLPSGMPAMASHRTQITREALVPSAVDEPMAAVLVVKACLLLAMLLLIHQTRRQRSHLERSCAWPVLLVLSQCYIDHPHHAPPAFQG